MVFERLKLAIKAVLGKNYAARDAVILAGDVILTSYPKSGNTWSRFLIANLVSTKKVNFADIENAIPDIYQHDNLFLLSIKQPRILKSHECFCPSYKKVIYIVRNPMDVAVSYYFHLIKFRQINENMPLDSFVDSFVAGELDRYGSWGENVGSWLGAKSISDNSFMLVRYEDLSSQPMIEMKKISTFLGYKKTNEDLRLAIDRSSLKNMKAMEKETGKSWTALKKTRTDMPFVREGKSGTGVESLSEYALNKIKNSWGEQMKSLGYL